MKGLVATIALASAVWMAPAAVADPLDLDQLKTTIAGMGYTMSAPLKPDGTPSNNVEITIKTASFNVPIGVEISASGRYIWCKASLGQSQFTGEDALAALKRATSIQPTNFWITSSGMLMIGIAIDNRDVTPEHLKFIFEKLAADVSSTSDLWQKPAAE
jgi:hypothetical protein